MSKFEDLERLARLLDEGKIDQQEFDRLKAELLDEQTPARDARHSTPAMRF